MNVLIGTARKHVFPGGYEAVPQRGREEGHLGRRRRPGSLVAFLQPKDSKDVPAPFTGD